MSALEVPQPCARGFQVISGYPRRLCHVSVNHKCPCRTWTRSQARLSPKNTFANTHCSSCLDSYKGTFKLSCRQHRSVPGWYDLHHASLQETWISTAKPQERPEAKNEPQAVQYAGVPRDITFLPKQTRRSQDTTLNCGVLQQLKPGPSTSCAS